MRSCSGYPVGAAGCLCLSAAIAAAACGGAPSIPGPATCPIESIQVTVEASQRLNMDEDGNPLATVVHIYLLKNDAAIRNADFEAMWRTPKEALGDEMAATVELTLFPGKKDSRDLAPDPEVRYVAVMGVFRKQTGTAWRSWQPVEIPGRAECASKRNPIVRHHQFFFEDYGIGAREP